MAKFAYNNAKNVSTGYTPFESNCGYHPRIFYKKGIIFCFKSKSVDKHLMKLQELITVYKKNLYHAQKL